MIDIETIKVNYDMAGWEKITEGWTKANVVPGAILAINALIAELESLQKNAYICKSCFLRKNDEHPKADF